MNLTITLGEAVTLVTLFFALKVVSVVLINYLNGKVLNRQLSKVGKLVNKLQNKPQNNFSNPPNNEEEVDNSYIG